jgi:hypothetical protein
MLYGRMIPAKKLRVLVFEASGMPSLWVQNIVEHLRRLPFVELAGCKQIPTQPATSRFAARLYRNFSLKKDGDHWQAVSTIPQASVCDAEGHPDVAIYIGDQPADGSCRGLARLGAYSILPGHSGKVATVLSQLVAGDGVIGFSLFAHDELWDQGHFTRQQLVGTQASLYYHRATSGAFAAAAHLLTRHLLNLASGNVLSIESPLINLKTEPGPPMLDIVKYLLPAFSETITANLLRRSQRKVWYSAWRTRRECKDDALPDPFTGGFHIVAGRPGMGYADPFPFHFSARDYLFLEEIPPDGRGRLVVTEWLAGQLSSDPPAIILERPYHLSYPMVFEHESDVFLIPESRGHRTVDLYRAKEFPFEWELDTTLVEGEEFVDTTPYFLDGQWYFFVATVPTAVEPLEGRLYVADHLRGSWMEHPASPVSTDPRRSRPAGRLFRSNGRLYRPVQDCSSDYGLAVRIMEIDELTHQLFREHEVKAYTTDWHPDAIRTHTWNADGSIEAIDASRWRKQ